MIVVRDLYKQFGNPPTTILHQLSFTINDGEFVAISGRSGSGKSTLLYIISTLDQPSSGAISIDKKNIAEMSVDQLHRFRNENVGFVFQFHYLLPELTALENVLLPARNLGREKEMRTSAIELLKELDVELQKDKLPSQMSGGQQQRVAIARALIMKPRYLFADEPTGNLDSKNANVVMNLIKRVHKEQGTCIALVTHESAFAKQADREIYLIDGKISRRDLDSD